ncbi:Transposable element Hobo transposase [Frankliniella fusca]|uniref:Transposable element Hobo transposase n=1 Tax=Frankliniella fusca TaxID=407009 RepID=A0AAE1I2N6_9NEOP|nr:Transposable element Hobo transposase [Frankliniella fusca]
MGPDPPPPPVVHPASGLVPVTGTAAAAAAPARLAPRVRPGPGDRPGEHEHCALSFCFYEIGTNSLIRHECTVAVASTSNIGSSEITLLKAHHRAKKDALEATAEFCAVDLRPVSIVEGEGFRALAQLLIFIGDKYGKVDINDLLSDPRTIRKKIQEIAESEWAEVYPRIQAAAAAEELAATLDLWSEDSSKESVMTCNVAMPELNTQTNEWEVKTYNFFTVPFPKGQPKNAENLRAFITKMFAERGINEEQMANVCFVTDGEAALKNALNKWWREYCSAHAYNIVYQHVMTAAPKDFQGLPPQAEILAASVENIVSELRKLRNRKLGAKIIKEEKLVFPKTFTRFSCVTFASDNFLKIRAVLQKAVCTEADELLRALHMGNLHALKEYMQNLEQAVGRVGHASGSAYPAVLKLSEVQEGDTDFVKELRTHLASNKNIFVPKVLQLKEACSSIVTWMKSTGHNSELTTTLKQQMEVRWNSFLRMLESIQTVYTELQAFFQRANEGKKLEDRNTRLEKIDKELLDQLVELFTPLKIASEQVQAKNATTAHLPLVAYYGLLCSYEDSPNCPDIINFMRSRMRSELKHVVKISKANKVAAFLDPSFRSFRRMVSEAEKTEVHGWVQNLLDGMEAEAPNQPDLDEPGADGAVTSAPSPPKKAKFDPLRGLPG